MKILVPTDFSETADKALQYAIDIFQKPGTAFILYHTFVPFESGFYSYQKSEEENNKYESQLRIKLNQKKDRFLLKNRNANIEIVIDRGIEEKGILNYATRHNADLIVMGTTGASGLKEKLVGSVTASVMSRSQIPVIGVPQKYEHMALRNIAFCSDFQLNDIAALKYLKAMFQADIQIWHFYKTDTVANSEKNLADDYKHMVNKLFGNKKITFHFSDTGNLPHAIEQLSEENHLDMLVLITHHRKKGLNGLLDRSLTKNVAFHTSVPLLAIPAGQN